MLLKAISLSNVFVSLGYIQMFFAEALWKPMFHEFAVFLSSNGTALAKRIDVEAIKKQEMCFVGSPMVLSLTKLRCF